MKLQKISNSSLKAMVNAYHESERTMFDMDFFTSLFPDETKENIFNALKTLRDDEFVSILPGDDVAYMTTLLPIGIRNCEENTMLKKGYQCIKEIKSLIR